MRSNYSKMEYCLGKGFELLSASTVLAVCQDSSVFRTPFRMYFHPFANLPFFHSLKAIYRLIAESLCFLTFLTRERFLLQDVLSWLLFYFYPNLFQLSRRK